MTPSELLAHQAEVANAMETYPDIDVTEAYRRWKENRGEKPVMLESSDTSITMSRRLIKEKATKPCTQEGCAGTMLLESVCGGCVEGRKGYRTKWTCQECMHRELLKEDYMTCLKRLLSQSKE